MTSRKNQTSQHNIFYFQEKPQVILDLTLDYTFEEIGFYSIFKSAYFLHKGKIPVEKLLQFCRVFDRQNEFKKWVENFAEIKDSFYRKKEFDCDIKFIEDKSKNKKTSVNKRWKGDTNVPTNVSTNVPTNGDTKTIKQQNNKTIKQQNNKTIFKKPCFEEIKNYCDEKNFKTNPKSFFDFYEVGNWSDSTGKKVKNWKQKLITWENRNTNSKMDYVRNPQASSFARFAKSEEN